MSDSCVRQNKNIANTLTHAHYFLADWNHAFHSSRTTFARLFIACAYAMLRRWILNWPCISIKMSFDDSFKWWRKCIWFNIGNLHATRLNCIRFLFTSQSYAELWSEPLTWFARKFDNLSIQFPILSDFLALSGEEINIVFICQSVLLKCRKFVWQIRW